jgi:hypothetical protein
VATSFPASLLSIDAEKPAPRNCSELITPENAVKRIKGVPGTTLFRIRPALSPFITGIEKSRTTRSGLHSYALAMTSWPLEASPQMLHPACSNNCRKVLLTTALSSARRMRFTQPRFRAKWIPSVSIFSSEMRALNTEHCTVAHDDWSGVRRRFVEQKSVD